MREWLVGGAVVLSDAGILLVQNRRRNGSLDWSPPGGVIDEGETLIEGLTREVAEETGLLVSEWVGPLYEIEAVAPDMAWHLRVQAWVARVWTGEVVVDDPDGIVVDARFVPLAECEAALDGAHRWVAEPLTEWLAERWEGSRPYGYEVGGADPATVVVTRL
jgi:8-oxo-dGTP diphosphatase